MDPAGHEHVLSTQIIAGYEEGQALPHAPQLCGSVLVSVHPTEPPQSVSPCGHAHCACVHTMPPLHWVSSVQPHFPLTHDSAQVLAHVPQLLESELVSVHPTEPPQSVSLPGHVHCACLHTMPSVQSVSLAQPHFPLTHDIGQVVPHVPQLLESEVVSVQPPQSV